jgi:hypothetical protein
MGFRFQAGSRVFTADTSYETTPKWQGFLMIKLAAFQASGWAEQRTAEYRISNRRISKGGFAALSLF